jgi:acyl carrier protein
VGKRAGSGDTRREDFGNSHERGRKSLQEGRERTKQGNSFRGGSSRKSVDIVELIAALEDEFGVEIPYPEARRRNTVGEAIDFVVRLRTR